MAPRLIKLYSRAWGYETLEDIKLPGHPGWRGRWAYNPFGDYIGSVTLARKLHRLGITPKLNHPGDKLCSIGYSRISKSWYGWGASKIKSFRPGSKVRVGDDLAGYFIVGWTALTNADARHMARLYAEIVNLGDG